MITMPQSGLAVRRPHGADAELDVQRVADPDRQQEVPVPAERHPRQEAVLGLALQAVGDGQAEQAVRDALAEVRLPRVLLVDVQRRAVARQVGVGVDHRAGDGHRRAHALVADLGVVPVLFHDHARSPPLFGVRWRSMVRSRQARGSTASARGDRVAGGLDHFDAQPVGQRQPVAALRHRRDAFPGVGFRERRVEVFRHHAEVREAAFGSREVRGRP